MLYVYNSNQMELQRQLLIEIIKSSPLDGVFSSEVILVQNPGMSQWLKLSLANDFGIAANISFPMPSSFIWNMFKKVISDIPEESSFTKDAMKWRLMTLLPKHLDDPDFSHLKEYVKEDSNNTKLYQLTDKIADLYDQYLVYRPSWIKSWESGEFDKDELKGFEWQPKLWKLLFEDTINNGGTRHHRANLFDSFVNNLNNGLFDQQKLPERIFLFGVSSLAPQYLESLKALGEHIDIHIMLTNPCKYFWGDILDRTYLSKLKSQRRRKLAIVNGAQREVGEGSPLKDNNIDMSEFDTLDQSVGNTLLSSMGKMGRDYLSLISQIEPEEIELFIDIPRDNLLHNIQADILNLEDKFFEQNLDSNDYKTVISPDDKSIILSGSYSKTREVEALHDYILSLFEKDQSLRPLDIVVMVANIDDYSSAINAVFGNAPRDRYIPFSVSDRTAQSENPILKSYLALLGLHKERCTASEILEILEVPAVMRKFGIDNDGLDTLRGWVDDTGIRWGLNEDTASSLNLPKQESNTWLFGVKRMLLGYAIKPDDGFFNGIIGFEDVEPSTAELAGSLSMFIDEIILIREILSISHVCNDWLKILNSITDTFFDIDKFDEPAINVVQANIHKIYDQLTEVRYEEKISPEIIFSHFYGGFNKDRISQNFMLGKVTFATLMPMRSIPFDSVCLLGMNDGVYPRATPPENFDLMAKKPMLGDRSRRNDDRFLFLEAFLSAKNNFYMSYIYKSVKDNTEKQPSVLISEVVDYCKKGYLVEGLYDSASEAEEALVKSITRSHPLMPFNKSAFEGEIHSYAAQWIPAANKLGSKVTSFTKETIQDDEEFNNLKEIDISELIYFWKLPVKAFFTKRLKVSFFVDDNTSKDDEDFNLNSLDAYKAKQSWLDEIIELKSDPTAKDQVLPKLKERLRAEGRLPLKNFGDISLESLEGEIDKISKSICSLISDEPDTCEISTKFNVNEKDITLTGWVDNIHNGALLNYRVGKMRTQDIMEAWILYLATTISSSDPVESRIISELGTYKFDTISQKEAKLNLQLLIEGYIYGLKSPLPFLPKTCGIAITAKTSISDTDESINKAKHKMKSIFAGGFNMIGEVKNSYVARVWSSLDENTLNDMYEAGIKYLLPAKSRLQEDKSSE